MASGSGSDFPDPSQEPAVEASREIDVRLGPKWCGTVRPERQGPLRLVGLP
jgi:hypothetical protein